MKRNLVMPIILSSLLLFSCSGESSYEKKTRILFDTYHPFVYIYGSVIAELPSNFIITPVSDFEFSRANITVLVINKSGISDEELSQVNELYLSGVIIVFYGCANYYQRVYLDTYQFNDLSTFGGLEALIIFDFQKSYTASYSEAYWSSFIDLLITDFAYYNL